MLPSEAVSALESRACSKRKGKETVKYCQNCGTTCEDATAFCPSCGAALAAAAGGQPAGAQTGAPGQAPQAQMQQVHVTIDAAAPTCYEMTSTDKTIRLIAFILNLITTICLGVFLVPLAWMIPMTVISWGIYKGKRKNTCAFGVCTLLFLNCIAGILLLCSTKDE